MSDHEQIRVWTFEHNVTCIVCPACAFTFDACHTDADSPDGRYSCPNCLFDGGYVEETS